MLWTCSVLGYLAVFGLRFGQTPEEEGRKGLFGVVAYCFAGLGVKVEIASVSIRNGVARLMFVPMGLAAQWRVDIFP